MRRSALWILSLLAALVLSGGAFAEKRVALVIGNAAYLQGGLSGSRADAGLMAEALRGRGFELVDGAALIDLDKRSFDRAIQLFIDQLRSADVGLFYYAGHAVNVDGVNFLVPVSFNPMSRFGLRDEAIDATALLDRMQNAGVRLKLMLLDASRENPFGGSFGATTPGLARIDPPADTIVSFATQPGRVVERGSSDQSIFTQALADAINQPGLSAFDVFREVDRAVQDPSGGLQRPWVMINSSAAGRFSFDESVAPAPPPTASAPSSGAVNIATTPPVLQPAPAARAPERAAPSPAKSAPPPAAKRKEPEPPKKQASREPPEAKPAATPKASPPAATSGGRCRSIQAMCALEIGGCCDQATGKWEYGRNGCGGSVMAHNNCISRKLAGQK